MSNITSGVLFMLISTFCFALMNAFAKVLSEALVPLAESVFLRSLIMVFVALAVYIFTSLKDSKKPKATYQKGGWLNLFIRVIMGALSFLAVFYNISTIPLGTASAFVQTMPLFAVMLGAIFLKEKLSPAIIIATIIGFIGILLISNPQLNGISLLNVAVGIFSGLSLAIAFVSLRGLSRHFSNIFIVLSHAVGSAILSALAMLLPLDGIGGFVLLSVREWVLVACMGGFGTLGQMFLNRAYLAAPVGIVSPINYAGILFSMLFGILLGDVLPSLATISGILLIIASGVLIAMPALLDDLRHLRKIQ